MVVTALGGVDPQSSPGLDGVPALLYRMVPAESCPPMLQHMDTMRRKGVFPDNWSQGIMRSLPQEAGDLSVEKRPIMLFNTKANRDTVILKLGMDGYRRSIIPLVQRGFVPGRSMDAHLYAVHEIQREGKTGCWIAMGFKKAFDTASHPVTEAFLLHAG